VIVTLARLQLALGRAATLVEPLDDDGPRQRFAARAPSDREGDTPSRLVIVHPAAPAGPTSGALLDRMAAIRAAGHPSVAAPLATGDVDGRAWVVEPHDPGHLVSHRLLQQGKLSVHDTIRLLRDLARALAALHRRQIGHGALTAETATLGRDGATLHGLGRGVAFSPAADLSALGRLGVLALLGRQPTDGTAELVRQRPAVPATLVQLLDTMLRCESARTPLTADAVLESLDEFPARRSLGSRGIVEGISRGARLPGQRRVAMLLAVLAIGLLVAWLVVRPG